MRLTSLAPADLNEAQRHAEEEAVAGVRGRVPAPMRAWIHSPTFASRAQQLGAFVRYGTSLAPALSELAILLTARHAACSYVWNAHAPEARKGGLDPALIAALARGETPVPEDPEVAVVIDYVSSLLATNRVSAEQHHCAVAAFGEAGLVELIGVVGYYTLVSMTMNAFAVELPAGVTPVFGRADAPVGA